MATGPFTPTTPNDTIAITNDNDNDQHSNTRAGDSEVGPASTTTTAPTPTQAQLLTNYYDHRPRSLQVINDADCNDAGTSDTDNSGHNKSYNGHNDLDDTTTKTTTTAASHQLWTGINKSNRANTNDYDRRDHSNINSSNDSDDTTTTATTLATTTTRSITTTRRQPQQQHVDDCKSNTSTTATMTAMTTRRGGPALQMAMVTQTAHAAVDISVFRRLQPTQDEPV
ncbi:hypothetical protein EDB83DRAFT_2639599 [Lactarius deliciosus]|nr:hypothetical protein EDB83DRAFT_2639599 [Lactarius deliciosus]